MTAAAPRLYNDVQGLAQLRADAARQTGEANTVAAREAARQFEALFVQMMMKSMRDASAALGAGGDTTYQEMFDQQIALEMTRGKGLGLADMLMRQLELTGVAGNGEGTSGAGRALLLAKLAAGGPAPALPRTDPTGVAGTGDTDIAALASGHWNPAGTVTGPVAGSGQDFRPASPAEFVAAIWPHAQAVARELDLDPRAIVAQAVLETGWGSRQIRDTDGTSGNNLFGIKADGRWTGRRITVQTLEYDGGIPKPERAAFRAYDSLAEGFADYAKFLRDNPRYAEALRNGRDPGRYAAALQAAGYATDPRYARKITDILESPTFREALAGLKGGDRLPM
jgi:flagellar protein FlgJ